jgi:uncharacterized membrane protein YkvA (DUF1232 family)
VTLLNRLRERANTLKQETYAVFLAARDPRTPWYAKVLAAGVVAYALSPLDLIPDFIPVLGYLDDLIIVPAGIALVLRIIPSDVMADCRERAAAWAERPVSWVGAAVMITIWVGVAIWAALLVRTFVD